MELLNMMPLWLFVLIAIAIVVSVITMAVTYLKSRELEEIREDVYQLILKAEYKYKESGQGKQKMKWVVSQARKLLPSWMQAIMSEDALMSIIQVWFNGIKDLLDDGKMNSSGK